MERLLRIGMIGGGEDSFMGGIHREAIARCGGMELVCGAFGATRQSSYDTGKVLDLPTRRVYGTYRDMLRREAQMAADKRLDFIVILTPNAMHYPVAMSAVDSEFSIFAEKPYTTNMDEALNFTRKLGESGLIYKIAMVYKNYPMLRKLKEIIAAGEQIGSVRKLVVNYQLGWMAQRLENAGSKQASWRADPRRSGAAGCLADLCSHCFYVAEWLSGLEVSAVCGDLRATVPGRIIDDDCNVLVRFDNEVRGVFLSSQIATGLNEGLSVEIFGDKGGARWVQGKPDELWLWDVAGKMRKENGGIAEGSHDSEIPMPYGNNEAYITALVESYAAFTELLRKGDNSEEGGRDKLMTIEEGLRSVAFVDAVLKNTAIPEDEEAPLPEKWKSLVIPPIPSL